MAGRNSAGGTSSSSAAFHIRNGTQRTEGSVSGDQRADGRLRAREEVRELGGELERPEAAHGVPGDVVRRGSSR